MLAGAFDAVGGMITLVLRPFEKPPVTKEIKKILVVRLDHIGDVVMTWPAIRALHKKFPRAEIDLLVDEKIAPLFEHSKEIHQVLRVKENWFLKGKEFLPLWKEFWRLVHFIAKLNYDAAFDFRGDVRNILLMFFSHIPHRYGFGETGGGFLLTEKAVYDRSLHQVLLNLSLLRSFHLPKDNKLLPFEYPRERASEFWQVIGEEPPTTVLPRVVVQMGAGTLAKCWDVDSFRALIQKIDNEDLAQIILVGTEEEKEALPDLKINTIHMIDLRGRSRLEDLPVLFDVCDIFIGNDSGPAHIAAAQGLEIILLASGTNDIRYWYPWTERLHILQHEVPCAPCENRICPVEGHPCMEQITVEQVFAAFQALVSRIKPA